MFKEERDINTVEDFSVVASDMFHGYLSELGDIKGMTRSVEEEDCVDDGFDFMYTSKGDRLARKYQQLMYKVGASHFPDRADWVEVDSKLYILP